jgi:hypothetical protein
MKRINSVLAFGDSHVAGCELSSQNTLDEYLNGKITIEQADAPGKELAFPNIVAKELNVPCYNYAMTGGSNDRSLRLLLNAVLEHENSLVLFGYTCTDRTEFYYPDDGLFLGRDNTDYIQVGMQWEGAIKQEAGKSKIKHPINTLFVENILRPKNNIAQMMFLVDSICTLYAKDYRHLPLFPETVLEVENVFGFQGYDDYLTWCKVNGFKQLPFLHYEQEAHERLAELILKDL